MTQPITRSNTKLDKVMNPEQFDQVVEAILAGKYSWACVLLLRFSGYNPLHYIPYRTYNRLVKENGQISRPSRQETNSINSVNKCSAVNSTGKSSGNCLNKITDLSYLEISEEHTQVGGGNLEQWLGGKIREYSLLKVELVQHKSKNFLVATGEFFKERSKSAQFHY